MGKKKEEKKQQELEKAEDAPILKETTVLQKQEEYAALKNDFARIIQRGLDGFQEKTDGRVISDITMRLQGRYGFIVYTNDKGLIEIPEMSGQEVDNQGTLKTQRMLLGLNAEVNTKDTVFGSVNLLRRGATFVNEFDVNAKAYDLLKSLLNEAKDKGEKVQKKIDNNEIKFYGIFPKEAHDGSMVWTSERLPNIDISLVVKLITIAKQTLQRELGAKLEKVKIMFFHIVDTAEIVTSNGSKIDSATPRTGIVVQAKTNQGNEIFNSIRGTGELEALKRFSPDKNYEEIVEELAKDTAKLAKDADRADSASILTEDETYVLLSGEMADVLVHEIFGHNLEGDIILENKKNTDSNINLKGRIGAQVSENTKFTIIDDGSSEIDLGCMKITNCFGSIGYDVEGTKAKRSLLIDKGIQVGVMTSSTTLNELAEGLKAEIKEKILKDGLTGNYRNERFDKAPMVRMTNTFCLPDPKGPKSLEEMAKEVPSTQKGIYALKAQGGWVMPDTGDFELKCSLGYLIENGTITDKPIKNFVIRGNITKFGNKIKVIGGPQTFGVFTGYCGKSNSWVPVEGGGPAMLVENATVCDARRPSLWKDSFEAYYKQMREMQLGLRKPAEVFFDFVDDVSDKAKGKHHHACLLAVETDVDNEVELLRGANEDYSKFFINENDELERSDD